ncbi:MAG: M48 family metallopeptidase [Acidimicrobiia bacterium]|nr:M48 family metallopeptidase [Acidimicrobiia bacterium]
MRRPDGASAGLTAPGTTLRQGTLPFDRPGSAPIPAPRPSPPIEYVRHHRAKRYLIRVGRDGCVRATIPRRGSKREAARFVEMQAEWIARQQVVAARLRAARRPAPAPHEVREARVRAQRVLPQRLLELADRFGLVVRKISIRNPRWRWGSCSRQGHICLNWRLVDMHEWVRDYVLIHELMHLRRMDHSPAFWKHVAVACPDYQRARRWLREHSHGLAEG